MWYALMFSICYLQILHSVKECAARLRPFSIYDSTGKICRYAFNMCQCIYVSKPGPVYSSVCFIFSRETSASTISMFFHHWYQLWAAWLEMRPSVTLLLMIQNVGRPSCLPLLVSLSDRSLCIQKCVSIFRCMWSNLHLSSVPFGDNTWKRWAVLFILHFIECRICLLSLQKHCSSCEHKDILYPLLGLIVNLSAVTSPVIQVRWVWHFHCLGWVMRGCECKQTSYYLLLS